MLRSIWIAAGAAVLLAAGALTAVAANSHGKAVSTLATSTTLKGEAKGDAISILAGARGETTSDAAKVKAKASVAVDADTDAEANDEDADADETAESENDAHGDAVSAVAKSDTTAAHRNGEETVNHGGAVSIVAHKHDK
jgi:hypothetical protein